MAHKRVTMQDIADVCGLSRNTVSKIFNGKGAVPEATRRMVIQKARELGYHQFPDNLFDNSESVAQAPQIQNIALLTNKMPTDYHFGTFLLPVFTEQLSRAGYTLTLHEISEGELRQCRLPAHMVLEQTAGVLGLELFDKPYLDMLCGLRVPTIFIDAYAGAAMFPLDCDLIPWKPLQHGGDDCLCYWRGGEKAGLCRGPKALQQLLGALDKFLLCAGPGRDRFGERTLYSGG